MIDSIEIRGYRALKDVNVRLSEFQVLAGSNGSGKSTFFDAFQLVRDILSAGLARSVFGDSRFLIPQRAADPRDLTWLRSGGLIEIALNLRLPESIKEKLDNKYVYARYEISIDTESILEFRNENMFLCPILGKKDASLPVVQTSTYLPPHGWRTIISKNRLSDTNFLYAEAFTWKANFAFGPTKSALANLPEDEDKFPAATWVKRFLMESVHRLSLNADALRLPSPAGSSHDFLPDGSNLPWVVHRLEDKHPDRLNAWLEHLRTSLDDIKTVRTIERPEDRSRYLEVTYANGLKAPSWLLSDGTLRMMALTLLAYAPSRPGLLLIEEPENGIHPQAIQSVMQSLSSVYGAQVFCATHSPLVLSRTDVDHLLCFGRESDGSVSIVRGSDHPRLREWKSAVQLGDLFAAGVLG